MQGDALKALDFQGTLVTDAALALSAHVGERIDVRRCALVEGALVSAYAHNGADGAGTAAGVVVACVLFFPSSVLTSFSAQVALDGGDDDVGRQLAMHCVAARPLAIDVDGLPPSLLDAERVDPGGAAGGLGEAGGRGEDSQRQVKQVRPGASVADAGSCRGRQAAGPESAQEGDGRRPRRL